MRQKLALFMAFHQLETENCFICIIKCNFELIFLFKNLDLNNNYAKSEQNHVKPHVFTRKFKPR